MGKNKTGAYFLNPTLGVDIPILILGQGALIILEMCIKSSHWTVLILGQDV